MKVEFVQKKMSRCSKQLYWSVSNKTPIRALTKSLGLNTVQRILVHAIDTKMYKCKTKEQASETFKGLSTPCKNFTNSNIRKQINKAILVGDIKLAKRLFKTL